MTGSSAAPIAVIGAGPYGLSVSAHLQARGLNVRTFGTPMYMWQCRMPAGMLLKSEGFASNLSSPDRRHTLRAFCKLHGLPYGHEAVPNPIQTFINYGLWFQQELVPNLEETNVLSVEPSGDGWRVALATGEAFDASRVVVAAGIGYFGHLPANLAHLPPDLLSHSSQHPSLAPFKGKDVTVIGAGQSALETAALLYEAGAQARLLVRKPQVGWASAPEPLPRPLRQRLRYPMSTLCAGWECWFYANAPSAFHYLPAGLRYRKARVALGPFGSWWLKERVVGNVPIRTGTAIRSAERTRGGVRLSLDSSGSDPDSLLTEHVIAATGYRVRLKALPFLPHSVQHQVRNAAGAPILSRHFEASIPGLYFVGAASTNSFGPVSRFVAGTDFAARRLARHLGAVASA